MKHVFYVLRSLKAQPTFFMTAVLTLALGIGFNALMFSAVHGSLVRPLPFPHDDDLLSLQARDQKLGEDVRTSPADFFDWRDQSTTLSHLGGYTASELHVVSNEKARRLPGATVTVGFFETLGVQPVIGRLLEDEDFQLGPSGSVVLSEGFWRREFGGNRSALGQTIKVASRPYSIVGVASDYVRLDTRAEMWVPMAVGRSQANRSARLLKVIGRRKGTATVEAVEAEMTTIVRRLAITYPDTNEQNGIRVDSLRSALLRDLPAKLTVLWGVIASVLVMICANIGLLLLSNTARRQGDLAVRIALGAARRWIVGQLVAETTVIAICGGGLGLVMVALGLRVLPRLVPDPALLAQMHVNGWTVAFTLGLSLVVGIALGCVAAFRMPTHDLRTSLSSDERGLARTSSHYLQRTLIVTELALTVALTVSLGLMLRSLQNLWTVDPGYEVESISTVNVLFPPRTYPPGSEQLGNYMRQAVESLEALPGVDHAASGFLAPLEGTSERSVQAEGVDLGGSNEISVALQAVSNSYFETMGLAVNAGHVFGAHERGGVALANEPLARLLFGEKSAVGQRVRLRSLFASDPLVLELVGVVESERLSDLAEAPAPTLYVPHDVELLPMATFYVRQADRSTMNLARSVQEALEGIDPEVAVSFPKSMRTIISDSLNEESMITLLLGISGGIALLLALMGVLGIWTLFVNERRREFGIRLSLGAKPSRILGEVVYKNLKLTIPGIVIGILLALFSTRFIEQWLFEVRSDAPEAIAGIAAFVIVASVVAGIFPAWRASRVDVMKVLRDA